mgnify:CR=1 FL=1
MLKDIKDYFKDFDRRVDEVVFGIIDGKAETTNAWMQRVLQCGYPKAHSLIDTLTEIGYIENSEFGFKCVITKEQYQEILDSRKDDNVYEIEIIEGHDPGSCFWIMPVIHFNEDWKQMGYLKEEEISIEEGDIDCFLKYFFFKYFDKDLYENKVRDADIYVDKKKFEWYLTDNFYTRETVALMLADIDKTAMLLANDYENPMLEEVKKDYSIVYMTSEDSMLWDIDKSEEAKYIKENISVVIDFYNRFTTRMRKMLENSQNCKLITICGP